MYSPGQVIAIHAVHAVHAVAELEELVMRMRGGLVCDVSAERGQLFGDVSRLRGSWQRQQSCGAETAHGRALLHCKYTDNQRVSIYISC